MYAEGTHIMVPWFERPIIYDVRARPSLIQSTSGSKDLQMASNTYLIVWWPPTNHTIFDR